MEPVPIAVMMSLFKVSIVLYFIWTVKNAPLVVQVGPGVASREREHYRTWFAGRNRAMGLIPREKTAQTLSTSLMSIRSF